MSTTNYLGLNIPDKNSKGRVVTEVFEPNFTKLDQNAEVVDRDKNAIWGGLDGGGLIEDSSVTKVVGKRYIGADGKAYICLVPSNINNSTNYAPCNVVDNLNSIQTMFNSEYVAGSKWSGVKKRIGVNLVEFFCLSSDGQENKNIILPDYVKRIIYIGLGVQGNKDTPNSIVYSSFIDRQTITRNSFIIVPRYTESTLIQSEPVYFHAICEI